LVVESGTRFVENDVKGDYRGTCSHQIVNGAGMEGTRLFLGIVRQVELGSTDLAYADDHSIRRSELR